MLGEKTFRNFFFAAMVGLVGACANGDDGAGANTITAGTDSSSDTDGNTGGDDDGSGICLLHNCTENSHCDACTEGRNTCLVEEKRCVACDPVSGEGCAEGEKCTEYGYCVPSDLECPTQDNVPVVPCTENSDCAACDPDHQVCDSQNCVQCKDGEADHCQSTEYCLFNECIAKCPEECTEDLDCSQCGEEGHEARACNAHRCSECSDTMPCGSGQKCTSQGACVDICGIDGEEAGTCDSDSDCAGCPGDTTKCHVPINGGHGVCGVEAAGCSDLGEEVAVLPEPFDQVTNLCSDANDCEGVGILYNIGKLLREVTGLDEIKDANIEYPMNECASVTVGINDNQISCGVCVPCKEDSDCQDIDIDEVADDAFGPLAALLLDLIFGPKEHKVYMFCQPIAAGYGACVPCPTLINDCAQDGGGEESGECTHDVCSEGGPLNSDCGDCAATVCAMDSFCCNNTWDGICVDQADEHCGGICSGGGGEQCPHDQCTEGEKLSPSCNSCVEDICDQDPYCCQTQWDGICVGHVQTVCGGDCGGGGGCVHSECENGVALDENCSSCASAVCGADPYCCSTEWDMVCVNEANAEPACSC